MEAKMSVFKRKTQKGETEFYHYRFKLAGKLYYGVCDGCELKRDAEAFEKELKQSISEAEGIARKGKKAFLEAFKEELSDGSPIPVKDSWDSYDKKPHSMGERHRETVKARWLDFVAFIEDNKGNIPLNKISKNIAEEYINQIRTNGPWSRTRLDNLAKELNISIQTVRKMAKSPKFPSNQSISEIKKWFAENDRTMTKEQIRKRKPYQHQAAIRLSSETNNNYLQTCKMILNALMDDAGLIGNPFNHIKKVQSQRIDRETFTPEELKLIADKSKGTWIYALFITGVNTGLREGDICTLKWEEVNLKTGWIERTMRKTGKSISIPLLPALFDYLKLLPKEGEYCFPELAERYFNKRATIGWHVREFLERIGINTKRKIAGRSRAVSVKDVHSCRHTFAYLAAINGVPFPIVQSVVGHMSPEMTKKYIDHASEQEKRKAFDLIPDYMGILEEVPDTTQLSANQKINKAISYLKAKKELSGSEKHLLDILS